jgi:hypothetical protein
MVHRYPTDPTNTTNTGELSTSEVLDPFCIVCGLWQIDLEDAWLVYGIARVAVVR